MKGDIYGEPVLIKSEKAIIRVFHPLITEEERRKRQKEIYNATVELLKAHERVKANEKT